MVDSDRRLARISSMRRGRGHDLYSNGSLQGLATLAALAGAAKLRAFVNSRAGSQNLCPLLLIQSSLQLCMACRASTLVYL
jgi:hypothetical protein